MAKNCKSKAKQDTINSNNDNNHPPHDWGLKPVRATGLIILPFSHNPQRKWLALIYFQIVDIAFVGFIISMTPGSRDACGKKRKYESSKEKERFE